MSPEQATGQQADWRSDIYSLGCILYFMVSGEEPLNDAEFKAFVFSKEEIVPNAISTGDERVDRIIGRMLLREPNNRCALLEPIIRLLEESQDCSAATTNGARLQTSVPSRSIDAVVSPIIPFFDMPGSKEFDVLVFSLALLCISFAGIVIGAYSGDLINMLDGKHHKARYKVAEPASRSGFLTAIKLAPPQALKEGTSVMVSYAGGVHRGSILTSRDGWYEVKFHDTSRTIIDSIWVKADAVTPAQ